MQEVKTLHEVIQLADVDMECTTYILLAFNTSGNPAFMAGGDIDALYQGAELITKAITEHKVKTQN